MNATDIKKPRIKSREYPAVTLNAAVEFISKFKDFPMNKPISYEVAANVIGVSQATKSFKYSISAARQYGLISTSSGNKISFLETAKVLLYPTGDLQNENNLKMQCFKTPKLYGELIQEYEGRALPSETSLENILISQYGISPSTALTAAQIFIETAKEVGASQYGILNTNVNDIQVASDEVVKEDNNNIKSEQSDGKSKYTENLNDKKQSYDFEIPTLSGQSAIIKIPKGVTSKDLEYIKLHIEKMLPVFINNLMENLEQ